MIQVLGTGTGYMFSRRTGIRFSACHLPSPQVHGTGNDGSSDHQFVVHQWFHISLMHLFMVQDIQVIHQDLTTHVCSYAQ